MDILEYVAGLKRFTRTLKVDLGRAYRRLDEADAVLRLREAEIIELQKENDELRESLALRYLILGANP